MSIYGTDNRCKLCGEHLANPHQPTCPADLWYDTGEPGAYGIEEVPPQTPDALTCYDPSCLRSWLDDITPAGRCPWEHLHSTRPPDFTYTVTVTAQRKAQADQVMAERISYDEDYGFSYALNYRENN